RGGDCNAGRVAWCPEGAGAGDAGLDTVIRRAVHVAKAIARPGARRYNRGCRQAWGPPVQVRDETDLEALLAAVNAGESGATDALCVGIHEQLRTMARRHLARDGVDRQVTIQPTLLANDTLMR